MCVFEWGGVTCERGGVEEESGVGGRGSDDFVKQEVAEGLWDGQRLHLLRGGHPAE